MALGAVASSLSPADDAKEQARQKALFDQADRNHDGKLSFDEALEYTRLIGAQSRASAMLAAPVMEPQPAPKAPGADDGFQRLSREEAIKKREELEGINEKEGAVTRTISNYLTIHESFFNDLEKSFVQGEDVREGITNPAKLTWTANRGSKSYYALDFAVQPSLRLIEKEPWAKTGVPIFGHEVALEAYPLFEAHVSTNPDQSQNQLLYAGVVQIDSVNKTKSFFKGDHFFIVPSYETDRHSDVRDSKLDVLWTPDWRVPGWGQQFALKNWWSGFPDGLLLKYRPAAGFEFIQVDGSLAKFLAGTHLPGVSDSFGFARFGITGELSYKDRFSLTAAYTYRAEVYGHPGGHSYLELSGLMKLDPANHFSAGITYTRGEDSPTFEDLDKFEAWVGVEF